MAASFSWAFAFAFVSLFSCFIAQQTTLSSRFIAQQKTFSSRFRAQQTTLSSRFTAQQTTLSSRFHEVEPRNKSNPTNSSRETHLGYHDKNILQINAGLTACFAVVAVMSLIGNGLVIHVVRTTPFMHTSVNVYIANMAVSDVISTLVCTPLMVKRLSISYFWVDGVLGLVLCRFVFFLFYTSFACSTFNLVAIAIDRYLAVTRPLFRYSKRTVKVIVLVIWMSSGILSVPIVNGYKNNRSKIYIESICYDFDRDVVYTVGVTIMAAVCYVIPLLGATILYALVGYKLRKRTQVSIGHNNDRRKTQAAQLAYSATKLMATIIIVFCLSWAPFFTYHLAKAWYRGRTYEVLRWYYRPLSFLLASINAAINPCLYFIFNSNFRSGFTRVMGCRTRRRGSMSLELQSSKGKKQQLHSQ